MRIAVLPVGKVKGVVLNGVRRGLSRAFPQIYCYVSGDFLVVPKSAYDPSRQQYVSTRILSELFDYAGKKAVSAEVDCRVLGVTDVDLYVPGLNFVFGEAQCPGKAAVISVHRLHPEFYGRPHDEGLFLERCVKEAVHEIGHTLGMRHCPEPACVMHFSLHIGMTDKKGSGFCEGCRSKAGRAIGRLLSTPDL